MAFKDTDFAPLFFNGFVLKFHHVLLIDKTAKSTLEPLNSGKTLIDRQARLDQRIFHYNKTPERLLDQREVSSSLQ